MVPDSALAITALMVDAMGGTISVRSEKGEGTTVQVDIPLAVDFESPKPLPPGRGRQGDREPSRRGDSEPPAIGDKTVP